MSLWQLGLVGVVDVPTTLWGFFISWAIAPSSESCGDLKVG